MSSELKNPKVLDSVLAFHKMFDAYIWTTPHIPSKDVCDLRVWLLQEELDELKEAIDNGDLVEIADAFTDIQYVLSGAIISFGMQDIFAELFEEVQSSNMSKACETREEAEKTVQKYAWLDQQWTIKEKDDKYLVLRDTDNKVLKSINYKPADIQWILSRFDHEISK